MDSKNHALVKVSQFCVHATMHRSSSFFFQFSLKSWVPQISYRIIYIRHIYKTECCVFKMIKSETRPI